MEVFKSHFEYLSGTGFSWVASSNGHTPKGAVIAGNTVTGEPLAIGRAHHEGSLTPGKVSETSYLLRFDEKRVCEWKFLSIC